VNQRRKTNLITKITYVEGVLCTKQADIKRAFLTYYQNLFRFKRSEEVGICLSGMARQITREMNDELLKPCTLEEVSQALQYLGPLKAPGLNGFSTCFYQ
jgi:hypothetical protein